MAITRARKMPKAAPTAASIEITPEQFIAGANAGPALSQQPHLAPEITNREERALALVRSYVPWAAGAGVLPLPVIDAAMIMGVQLRMLARLSASYGVPFREQAAKSIIAALMALEVQHLLTGGLASAFKSVPVVGTLLAIAVLPAIAAAATFAIGKVFITHFEAGGTFLDFDPAKVQKHFRDEFENARAATTDRAGS